MAQRWEKPSGGQYATYLAQLLGQGYQVTYQPRVNERGEEDPRQSFFHITQADPSSGVLATNIRIDLGDPSAFHTTYGGQSPTQRPEYTPRVLTTGGRRGWDVGGSWQSIYSEDDSGDWSVQHQLMSPGQALSNAIRSAFEDTRNQRLMGNRHTTVEGRLSNILAEGYSGYGGGGSVARGTLSTGDTDVAATRRRAAQAISLIDITSSASQTNELVQKRRILQSRLGAIETADPANPMFAVMRRMGYGPHRDDPHSRFTPYGHASKNVLDMAGRVIDTMTYLPTPKFTKHQTITNTGRQMVQLLGPENVPLRPSELDYSGEGNITTPGYAYTTAQAGGRVPQKSLILNTLLSPQYPIPGAGMYFPENVNADIQGAGYQKTPSWAITANVSGLLRGQVQFKPQLQPGQQLQSSLGFQYGELNAPGFDEPQKLRGRQGSSTFVVGQPAVRVPRYYDAVEGVGRVYSAGRLAGGSIREVTEADRLSLEQRWGAPVVLDELVDQVIYEAEGYSLESAKIGTMGMKSDVVPYQGTPQVSFAAANGEQRQLPIDLLTWESKSVPEMFIGAMAALSPHQQNQLLGEYAASLGKTGDDTRSQMVTSYRDILRQTRETDPRAVLDLDELSFMLDPEGGFAPQELAKDLFRRVFFSGLSQDELENVSPKRLNELAASKANRQNLADYGIGFIAPGIGGMEVTPITNKVSVENMQAMKNAYLSSNQGVTEDDFYQTYGFDPAERGDTRTQTIMPYGFRMPVVAGPSVEFAGGGTIGAEESMLINELSPGFANRLGISLQDLDNAGALSRNVRDPVKWAQGQIAMTAAANAAAGENTVAIPGALTITGQTAQQMMADPDFQTLLGRQGANMTGLQAFSERLKEFFPDVRNAHKRPVQFEGAEGLYLPSVAAIKNIGVEDASSGEDITRNWERYQQAFMGGVEGVYRADPSQIVRGTAGLTQHFQEMFGLPQGDKKNVIKSMLGSDAGWSVQHYAYWDQLKPQQVYGSEELFRQQIRRELSSQGLDTPEHPLTEDEVSEVYRYLAGEKTSLGRAPQYVREKGIPGVALRYPVVGGKDSVMGVQFLTPEHLKKMGMSAPLDKRSNLSTYHWRMGLPMSTILQGDFDLDYLAASLGLTARRTRKGGMKVGFAGMDGKRIDPDLNREIDWLATSPVDEVLRRYFPSKSQREAFDPLYGAVHQDERPFGRTGLGAVASLIGGQMKKAGFYQYKTVSDSTKSYAGAKLQMGSTYNFTRALESAAAVRGWSTQGLMRSRTARAGIYQPFLDMTTSMPIPMANMFQTSLFAEDDAGNLAFKWMLPGEDQTENPTWTSRPMTTSMLKASRATGLVNMMAGSAIYPHLRGKERDLPSPDILAWAFSPEESMAFPAGDGLSGSDARYQVLRRAEQNGYSTERLNRIKKRYYSGMDLYSALSRPYAEENLSLTERAGLMRETLTDWTKINYGDRPSDIFKSPLITAMFGKSMARERRIDPAWEPSQAFQESEAGRVLMDASEDYQTLYSMEKGGIAPADRLLKLMKRFESSSNPMSSVATWAVGGIRNIMGMGRTREVSAIGRMYQELEASPVSLRSSNISAIIDPEHGYTTETTIGEKRPGRDFNVGGMRSVLSTMTGLMGLRMSDPFMLEGALFPAGKSQEIFRQGLDTEARLGQVMGRENNWYTPTRTEMNERGEISFSEENAPSRRYRSSFAITTSLGEGDNAISATVAAKPDFLRLVRDEKTGDLRVYAVEQKTPLETTSQASIDRRMAGEWQLQQRTAPWIVNEQLKRIAAGDDIERRKLEDTLATYGIAEELIPETMRSLQKYGLGSMLLNTQQKSDLWKEIHAKNPNPEIIQGMANKILQGGGIEVYEPTQASLQETGQKIYEAAKTVKTGLPKLTSDVWRLMQAAPGYWKQARLSAFSENEGRKAQDAGRRLDIVQQVWGGMRSMGQSAIQAAGTAVRAGVHGPIPQVTLRSTAREAAQIGPNFEQLMSRTGMSYDEYQNYLQQLQTGIEQGITSGQAQTVSRIAGVPLEEMSQAVGEVAKTMGYRSEITLPEDDSGLASIAFSPIGPEPVAPEPPTEGEPYAYRQDPVFKNLLRQHHQLGLRLNEARNAGDDESVERIMGRMDAVTERANRRVNSLTDPSRSERVYQRNLAAYQQARAEWEQTVTVRQTQSSPVPGPSVNPSTAQQSPPPTQTPFIPSPSGGGAASGGGGGGTTGTIPGPSTGSGLPGPGNTGGGNQGQTTGQRQPPTGGRTLTRPTAMAQRFVEMYNQYGPMLSGNAVKLRQAVEANYGGGTVERGKVMGRLSNLTPEDVRSTLGGFRQAGAVAQQLVRLGEQVNNASVRGTVDESMLPTDYMDMVNEVIETGGPRGKELVDLMQLFEFAQTGADKTGNWNLRQVQASGLVGRASQARLFTQIRQAMGVPTTGSNGLPIESLSGILGDAGYRMGPQAIEGLRDFLNQNPEAQSMLRQSMGLVSGTGSKAAQVFGATKDYGDLSPVLQLAELGKQLKGQEGFEFLSGRAKKPEKDMSSLAQHFERLNKITAELTNNFDKLQSSGGDYHQEIERRTKLLAQQKVEEARLGRSEAAQPLVEAGILSPVSDRKTRQISYQQAQAVPEEMMEQYRKYEQASVKAQDAELDQAQTLQSFDKEPQNPFARFFRRAFGGFGLMYMRSIAGIATQGLETGFAERSGLDQVLYGAGSSVSGAALVPYNQRQIMANRMALQGNNFYGLAAMQNAVLTTPGLSDVYTAGSAGLGSYAAVSWAAGQGLPQLAKFAGPIGVGVAGASLALSAAQKSRDVEGLGFRYAANDNLGQALSVTDAMGALFASGGIGEVRDVTQQYQQTAAYIEKGLTPASITGAMGLAGQDVARNYTRQMRLLLKDNQDLSPEAIAEAFQFAQMTGTPANRVGEIAANMQTTGYTPAMAGGVLGALGRSPQQIYAGGQLGQMYLGTMGTVSAQDAFYMNLGVQGMGSFSQAAYFAGQGMNYGQMINYATQLGGIQGTPMADVYAGQMNQWNRQRMLGWQSQQPQLPTGPVTQEELGLEALRQGVTEGRINATEQYGQILTRYLGYDENEAQRRMQGMEGRTEQGVQREVDLAEQIARMGGMQRVIQPGQPDQFYTNYMRQVESMEPVDRNLAEESQRSLVELANYLKKMELPGNLVQSALPFMQENWTPRQIERYASNVQWSGQTAQDFASAWGLSDSQRTHSFTMMETMSRAGTLSPWMKNVYQGVAGFEPFSLTQAAAYGNEIPGIGQIPGWMATRDILGPQFGGLAGTPLNQQAFTVSGASHPLFQLLQQMMPQGTFSSGVGQAFAQGYAPSWLNGQSVAGTMGMQFKLGDLQYQMQAQAQATQMAQIGLQEKYQPQFWQIQDALRQLGYEQQEWNFDSQERQLAMSSRQWEQNTALSQRQTAMQRGWTREDWGFQDWQRQTQWQWRQEDFQDEVRFMTGRQRKIAERQNRRETIMYGAEGEQIDKQRQRQEELWKLEDERFELARQHHEENKAFQEEQIAKAREFFEERRRLEEEYAVLQRQYQQEQLELQKQQAVAQASLAEQYKEAQDIQNAIALLMIAQQGGMEALQEKLGQSQGDTQKWIDDIFASLVDWVQKLDNASPAGSAMTIKDSDKDGVPDVDDTYPQDPSRHFHGGRVRAGEAFIANDIPSGEPEVFRSDQSGQIIPLSKFDPWKTMVMPGARQAVSGGKATINVYLGNELLRTFVIDTVDQDLRL